MPGFSELSFLQFPEHRLQLHTVRWETSGGDGSEA